MDTDAGRDDEVFVYDFAGMERRDFFTARHACVPPRASREILRFAQDDTKMRYRNQIGRVLPSFFYQEILE